MVPDGVACFCIAAVDGALRSTAGDFHGVISDIACRRTERGMEASDTVATVDAVAVRAVDGAAFDGDRIAGNRRTSVTIAAVDAGRLGTGAITDAYKATTKR